jgi:nucleoside-diphosphate-sugar epimerase
MKVLILGGHGYLGPHVVEALEGDCELRITDIKDIDSPHETRRVDASNLDQVMEAAEGMDVIVNCSVLRHDRKLAFDVNTLGTYNAIRAAVEHGMERFINTGPHFTISGDTYYRQDFAISEEIPPHADTGLYALSKSAGQEICRVFSENYSIHVLCTLFLNFAPPEAKPARRGRDLNSFAVTFRDAAQAIKCALEVDLARLPSKNEIFYITADLPHGKYSNQKTRRLLGWEPQDTLEEYWRKAPQS